MRRHRNQTVTMECKGYHDPAAYVVVGIRPLTQRDALSFFKVHSKCRFPRPAQVPETDAIRKAQGKPRRPRKNKCPDCSGTGQAIVGAGRFIRCPACQGKVTS